MTPFNFEQVFRVLMEEIVLKPMDRLMELLVKDTHMTRKFVNVSIPFSPLLPFVSSTSVRWSMTSSPGLSCRLLAEQSKRNSWSCHTCIV